MNLSPSWIDRLVRHGFEAVHGSTTGAATATDAEILRCANEHGFVLITNDLDFSSISPPPARRRLALSRSELRTCFLTRS